MGVPFPMQAFYTSVSTLKRGFHGVCWHRDPNYYILVCCPKLLSAPWCSLVSQDTLSHQDHSSHLCTGVGICGCRQSSWTEERYEKGAHLSPVLVGV